MENVMKNIQSVLKTLGIEEGTIINIADLPEDGFGDSIRTEKLCFNDVESFLENHSGVKGIIADKKILEEQEKFMSQSLRQKMAEMDVALIICVENPVDRQTVFKLLSGQETSHLDIHGYTGAGVSELMQKSGFTLVAEESLLSEVKDEKSGHSFLAEGSMIHHYLTWLDEYVGAKLDAKYLVQAYRAEKTDIVADSTKEHPFLSIITRTQGRRPEALSETFLSLNGQSCMDFEVLVMGHNLNSEERGTVEEIIEETPDYLREKIRFIPVEGGNRSTPINRGFEAALGEYAVILDDDDIVFDNWVSSFKEKAEECPGSVLHAYVIAQDWASIQMPTGENVLRACGSPQSQFCKDFNWISELNGNYCPVLGLAFPLYPFRKMHFRFDETLDTTEDWDFLMRVASICGVADIKEPTSIYRLWKNSENSHSLHTQKEWDDNRKKIQNRFRKKPLLLPERYADELIRLQDKQPGLFGGKKNIKGVMTPLYYDNGYGYTEKCVSRTGSRVELPSLHYEFLDFESLGEISSIRWDPYEFGNIYLENLRIEIYTADGRVIVKRTNGVSTNGFKAGNRIFFFHPDPQVIIRFRKKQVIKKVVITGMFSDEITEDMHNYLAMQYDANVVQKTKKAVKIVGKKILRK
ncbi:glycosyltransferase family 2 protein [Sporofaciens sp. SGI.106]|uniref:glycosyltransferase family 2 protein n=1 Tax=Sporofaciens sp. SGI.106 TaxID=3420568 RepID=UPI003D028975